MSARRSISPKCLVVSASLGLCISLLAACSDSGQDAKKTDKKVEIQQPVKKAEKSDAEKKLASLNQPRSIELPPIEMSDLSKYQDMMNPLAALRIYTVQHTWDETQDDVVDSVKNAIKVKSENPDLYKYGYDILTENDAFKKKDLSDKVFAIVKEEGAKSGSNRLVKAVIPDHLAAYDFSSKGFKVDSCMFSDKLEYSDEEMRNPASFRGASPVRCYYSPGPADYRIGLTGGSSVFFDVSDEAQARRIEAARPSSNIVVYGYVKNIERETITDHFGPKRYVLVAPQRVDVVDTASGTVLLSKNL